MTSGQTSALPRLRIGVSACLLGREVRYDGGHKREAWIAETLDPYVEWVDVCPEVELGLSTPRPTLQLLTGEEGETRLYMPDTGSDYSHAMRSYAEARLEALAAERLAGYIFKSKSPSCGLQGVEVYEADGSFSALGRGLFAEALVRRWPSLPVAEEGRLRDPQQRASFVWRAFAHAAWLGLEEDGFSRETLTAFHRRHELLLLAFGHSEATRLGELLTDAAKTEEAAVLAGRYRQELSRLLRCPVTAAGHVAALQRAQALASEGLEATDREDLSKRILEFREGRLPLRVPLELLHRHAHRLAISDLAEQLYLRSEIWALAEMAGS